MKNRFVPRAAAAAATIAIPLALLLAAGCAGEARQASVGAGPVAPSMPASSLIRYDTVEGFPQLAASMTPPDLTAPGSWSTGVAQVEIMDTRTFDPQVQTQEFAGEPTIIKHILPPHHRDKALREGAAHGLVAGEVTDRVNTAPGALFPAIKATPWSPPDPTLAVGPNHVLQTVNMDIAWYDKQGNVQFQSRLDSTGNPGFFETIGAGNFTFDPKCFYDHLAERFVVVALEVYGSSQAWIDIAVSDDSDPNGVWYKYRTDARIQVGNAQYWVDYPGFGYDGQAYYVNGNLFLLNGSGGGFAGVVYRSFDKSKLLAGQPAVYTDVRDSNGGSAQAAQHFGSNTAAFFTEAWSTSSIRLIALKNALTAPQLVTTEVNVPSYGWPSGGAPNNGGTIDVLDGRMMNAVWRNGKLLTGHGVRINNKTQSRWYEFNTNNWPNSGSPSLAQSGNIDGGSGVHTFFPALYSNNAGDIGLVTAASASNQFASVRYTGRKAGDPAGTMGALTNAKTGTAAASGRWGDYFDMALDPDGRTFWICGEYNEAGGWATWISSFTMSCPADFNGDGAVNTQDVLAFLNEWAAGNSSGDWNNDGTINTLDVLGFLNDYNTPC